MKTMNQLDLPQKLTFPYPSLPILLPSFLFPFPSISSLLSHKLISVSLLLPLSLSLFPSLSPPFLLFPLPNYAFFVTPIFQEHLNQLKVYLLPVYQSQWKNMPPFLVIYEPPYSWISLVWMLSWVYPWARTPWLRIGRKKLEGLQRTQERDCWENGSLQVNFFVHCLICVLTLLC